MYCSNCGAELPDYAEFCQKCGSKVKKPNVDNYSFDEDANYDQENANYNQTNANYGQPNGNYDQINGFDHSNRNAAANNVNTKKNKNKIIITSVVCAAAAAAVVLFLMFGLPKNKSENIVDGINSAIQSEISDVVGGFESDESSENEGGFVFEFGEEEESESVSLDTSENPEIEQDAESNEKEEAAEKEETEEKEDAEKTEDVERTEETSQTAESSNNNSAAASTAAGYGTAVVFDTDYVTLRSDSRMSGSEIMKLNSGDSVTIKSINSNGYFKVDHNGTEGYVVPSYLSLNEDAQDKVKSEKTYKVITDYVTLRDIPATSGAALDKITTGAVLEYFSDAQDGFCLVRYNGRFGYVLKNYNGETLLG